MVRQRPKRSVITRTIHWMCTLISLVALICESAVVCAFTTATRPTSSPRCSARRTETATIAAAKSRSPLSPPAPFRRLQSVPSSDDLGPQLARARALLEKSKAKLAAKEEGKTQRQPRAGESSLNGIAPKDEQQEANGKEEQQAFFFAAQDDNNVAERRRAQVIKNTNSETGLVTADGEKMARLSEEEAWESRSLFEVFENEIRENEDVYSRASQQLATRDVAASIWNLRKALQTEDYRSIFDSRNRFIGEDN